MNLIEFFIGFIFHLDKNLSLIIQAFGHWSYLILFLIIFCETGLVITPFLPGDSLIFLCGAFASSGAFSLWILFFVLSLATIIGDTVNYWAGHFFGPRIFRKDTRILKKEYLDETYKFYEKHGGKTIILARFIPIIRTFAPFVAGIGKMSYSRFIIYNIIGGISWISLFLFGGYYLGNIPIVKENLSLVILLIIFVSLLPSAVKFFFRKKK
ncbi:MAG: hypothetical protein COY38_00770 [Candidatus Aenigmarchaeota archaeon CG_4_10_14_0_8_um_filter_37_24]|nr:DedA family protein [Candidatus Aenigmarchaeota archaeon]OIN86210.1 MAG: hypothetical protein AUJ50_04005 [Candidatus Aenigmarchaeota archaeon CG1_02_38_14]PIV69061.1 MAG: hypothetical protein COS07_02035 [Candidatus Aenigmarchaeota archaeon CG01_land_8_20_14_3_00_37_9]PIW41333.1 MAG: hypothetical protein COW21_02385 [Candidatus Aenigmarchaeota archaeon CG15_BIG_FIL_POST_REV_8_21_14_020_37_27]PIX50695.1 MAG: hypothetical protein COZ52_02810 [Candidatus Aenigmarchaeota archaeon CG_4_8_14_3_um